MAPVIVADRVGIRFHRNRKRHMRWRDLAFRRELVTESGEFWALRDISFTVEPGETVGLIGANGQGKSTLLRVVAGVLLPDAGRVEVNGGVAPLIEITGGFAPDLTARDNINLAAGLHGMSRKEVARRFDEIVDFAEVGDFLDTPYRHFSSGMKVRLAFSVVTSLDEPIVLVDEVLAVGDRAFKEKCYTRIDQMVADGKTFFMVSHSENDLRRFCTRGLYLREGALVADGPLDEVLEQYVSDSPPRRRGAPVAAQRKAHHVDPTS